MFDVKYNEKRRIFHLYNSQISYVLSIVKDGYLAHLYFGKRIEMIDDEFELELRERVAFSPTPYPDELDFSLDHLPQEYPGFGTSDFREPAYSAKDKNCDHVFDFRYLKHEVFEGKKNLKILPSTHCKDEDAKTLEITLEDSISNVQVVLSYTIFSNFNIISRNALFKNNSDDAIMLDKVSSMSIDFSSSDYDLIHLYGAWGKERHIERKPLLNGTISIESKRGVSSHQHNPFIALASKNCCEDFGEVYGFSLVYSGSFKALVEVDQFDTTRVMMGINDFQFRWKLNPHNYFQSPECVMVYSANGLTELSSTFHDFYRDNLVRSKFKDIERPIVINNWEATYFNFTSDKLQDIAKDAKELGIEQFVLDDGWFGNRDNDDCSLGDWYTDLKKIPEGLDVLSKKINDLGLGFGLWVEPEMISMNSDLYKSHPDWCIHIKNRKKTQARKQLVLDLSRKDVQDYIISFMSSLLNDNNINYIKWDMNRPLTEMSSALLENDQKGELQHRYVLGLYHVLDVITNKFPHVLFESCSGGGGRFDPGMFYYMPQAWTSDDSDAVERLKIQYGTSLVYPPIFMGAQVSDVPNHQVFRSPSFKMRGDVAMFGNFGYSLDLNKISKEERESIKEQVLEYKNNRKLIQNGSFYRLINPFEGNSCAWMIVSKNKEEAIMAFYQVLVKPNASIIKLKCKGLCENKKYFVKEVNSAYTGSYLMNVGLVIPLIKGDYASFIFSIKMVS
ncbi:MAG: alpha-galactosidase [Anaerorhabdus sp.]